MTPDQIVSILNRLYPSTPWPERFRLFTAAEQLAAGTPLAAVAKACGTTKPRVSEFVGAPDPVAAFFGAATPAERPVKSSRQMLGNLIVGRCAEKIFVERYKAEAATHELALSDLREGRSDTDYRLLNGKGRPVYRINIKFIGSQFRRAPELVKLEPTDCFALATYKIHAALQKQESDKLPFIFVVVSVPGLSAEQVGAAAPAEFLEFLALLTQGHGIPKKRDLQDRVVSFLEDNADPGFLGVLERIRAGRWYVLSARRADRLLRTMLFDRVYALRIRGFAQQFRGAELDMHFSLSQDLTPLETYLHVLREDGYPVVTTLLERGDY